MDYSPVHHLQQPRSHRHHSASYVHFYRVNRCTYLHLPRQLKTCWNRYLSVQIGCRIGSYGRRLRRNFPHPSCQSYCDTRLIESVAAKQTLTRCLFGPLVVHGGPSLRSGPFVAMHAEMDRSCEFAETTFFCQTSSYERPSRSAFQARCLRRSPPRTPTTRSPLLLLVGSISSSTLSRPARRT